MVGRVVDQPNLQPRPIAERNYLTQELTSHARVFGAVVQIDHEAANAAILRPHTFPPHPQAVTPEVAALLLAENKRQQTSSQDQYTEGDELLFGRWIMVECLRDFAVGVGSRFFPRENTRRALPLS